MQRFDVIVVGTGVAGRTAAGELSAAGKQVAIVDVREYGGTCALRGCHPKKILFSAAEVVERARGQAAHGVSGAVAVEWPSLIAFKRSLIDPMPAMLERGLTDSGVTVLHGAARFVASDMLDIGGTAYQAEHIVLATGAVPLPLGIPGAELAIDAEGFMAAPSLGARVAFIGGGYISFEFAHIAAAAGSAVTVLHRSSRVLKEFDPDLVDMLVRGYREAGIDVRTDAPVAAVRRAGDGYAVELGDGSTVACDMVVHGAGRVPDIAGLDLEAGGVEYGRRGVAVDATMRSVSNPRVFAAGDSAAVGPPLTPVGIAEARVAAANILQPGSTTFAPAAVPSAVFADPPLASVGLTEAQAKEGGLDVVVKLTDTSGWESSRRVGVRRSGAKTIVDRETGALLGAHLLGHGADEVVNVLALAIASGLTAGDLKSAIWAYPTAGSDIVYLL